jgi:hypothetical protein
MSLELVERIAKAVLYEGYVLYPYKPSSVKNQRRFTFGVLVPPSYAAVQSGSESSTMQTECLVCGGPQTTVDVRVRFLQVISGAWQTATERAWGPGECALGDLVRHSREEPVRFTAEGADLPIEGTIALSARLLEEGLYRLAVNIVNQTRLTDPENLTRDQVLPYSLAAVHTILEARHGEFVSLLDPPDLLRAAASDCRNIGTWPVLAGEPDQRRWMLSSPIILYDYPQIAPESPGDLFDGTEIDEILTLRILTLTEQEKVEIRNGDERARRILERTEALPEEHLMKLHGVLRSVKSAEESE